MPLPISHSLLGASLIALFYPKTGSRLFIPFALGVVLANAADFDFGLVFLLGAKEWHRGFSHSILFSLLFSVAILAGAAKFQKIKEALVLAAVFASHFILDFVTTKIAAGVELFWFFDSGRFGLRWFSLSEYPSKMTLRELLTAILIEIFIFAPIFLLAFYYRKSVMIVPDNE